MKIEGLIAKLRGAGVRLEESNFDDPKLLSFFTPIETPRRIKWLNKDLVAETEGKLEFSIFTGEDRQILIQYEGRVDSKSIFCIEEWLINDDVACAKLEKSKYFSDRLIIKNLNHWKINGKTMYGNHLYEAIYEYITGEHIVLEEYVNIKEIGNL